MCEQLGKIILTRIMLKFTGIMALLHGISMIVLHWGLSPECLLLGCGCCGAASFQSTCSYYSIVVGLIFNPQGLVSLYPDLFPSWPSALSTNLWKPDIETMKVHYGEGLSFVGY